MTRGEALWAALEAARSELEAEADARGVRELRLIARFDSDEHVRIRVQRDRELRRAVQSR